MSEHPIDVLREAIEFVCDEYQQHPHPSIPLAALRAVEQLEQAARRFEREYQRQRGAVLGAGDFLLLEQAQDDLRAALALFDRKEQP